ncbi:hypothetical protein DV515_00005764 [Chloebia gouldiae]|uniref:Uncharacterized protein n=1 Tax=Chloebia gouldiae TaxID=44316 RepID=A0A3L8SM37_CHLGU|nr:hypothetical protein DV515_00005764 [Chloebia gouldiae]
MVGPSPSRVFRTKPQFGATNQSRPASQDSTALLGVIRPDNAIHCMRNNGAVQRVRSGWAAHSRTFPRETKLVALKSVCIQVSRSYGCGTNAGLEHVPYIGWEAAEPCCCVAVPQDAGRQATQTGANREADASSLGFGNLPAILCEELSQQGEFQPSTVPSACVGLNGSRRSTLCDPPLFHGALSATCEAKAEYGKKQDWIMEIVATSRQNIKNETELSNIFVGVRRTKEGRAAIGVSHSDGAMEAKLEHKLIQCKVASSKGRLGLLRSRFITSKGVETAQHRKNGLTYPAKARKSITSGPKSSKTHHLPAPLKIFESIPVKLRGLELLEGSKEDTRVVTMVWKEINTVQGVFIAMSLLVIYQHLSEEGGIAEEKELCKELDGSHSCCLPGRLDDVASTKRLVENPEVHSETKRSVLLLEKEKRFKDKGLHDAVILYEHEGVSETLRRVDADLLQLDLVPLSTHVIEHKVEVMLPNPNHFIEKCRNCDTSFWCLWFEQQQVAKLPACVNSSLCYGNKAFVVNMTVRYEHNTSSLREATAEKAKKYQRLHSQINDLTNAVEIDYVGFPIGARGKWFNKNSELLLALGLSKLLQFLEGYSSTGTISPEKSQAEPQWSLWWPFSYQQILTIRKNWKTCTVLKWTYSAITQPALHDTFSPTNDLCQVSRNGQAVRADHKLTLSQGCDSAGWLRVAVPAVQAGFSRATTVGTFLKHKQANQKKSLQMFVFKFLHEGNLIETHTWSNRRHKNSHHLEDAARILPPAAPLQPQEFLIGFGLQFLCFRVQFGQVELKTGNVGPRFCSAFRCPPQLTPWGARHSASFSREGLGALQLSASSLVIQAFGKSLRLCFRMAKPAIPAAKNGDALLPHPMEGDLSPGIAGHQHLTGPDGVQMTQFSEAFDLEQKTDSLHNQFADWWDYPRSIGLIYVLVEV